MDAGELGDIHYIYSNRLNLGKVRHEENILWSFAPHDISVILLLAGRACPSGRRTSGQSYLQHEIADVTMTTPRASRAGARAHIFVSWLHPFKEQKLVVVGSRRWRSSTTWSRKASCRIFDKGIDWSGRPAGDPPDRRSRPCSSPSWSRCARSCGTSSTACARARRPRTDGRNGLRVLRVLDACQRSLDAGGQPVALKARSRGRRTDVSDKHYFVHEIAATSTSPARSARAPRSGTSAT